MEADSGRAAKALTSSESRQRGEGRQPAFTPHADIPGEELAEQILADLASIERALARITQRRCGDPTHDVRGAAWASRRSVT